MPSIRIKGMSCGHCVASVTEALRKIEGVSAVAVDLATGTASFEAAADFDRATLIKAIRDLGFTAE